jgi:uroporphyrinogen decarboxylase
MSVSIDSEQRVLAALAFQRSDRVPLYDSYWPEFEVAWRAAKGLPADANIGDYYGVDLEIVIPDEMPWPSAATTLEATPTHQLLRTGWGVVQRVRTDASFYEEVAVPLPERGDLDDLAFESPLQGRRYAPASEVAALARTRCVFVKTGGPYLRTSNLRGLQAWLGDLVEDPDYASELAMRVTQHLTAVGLEAIRRYDLYHTGVWFYDDMGANTGPMFSPRTFERVLYPCYRWMCAQYRAAGVQHILLHCDGNINPFLDMLIDAGIQGFHPVEPKAGMDVVALRKRYGRQLALLGGLDNAHILPRGSDAEVEAHVHRVLEVGQDGGLVIGAHSIGPDISVARYDLVQGLIRRSHHRETEAQRGKE